MCRTGGSRTARTTPRDVVGQTWRSAPTFTRSFSGHGAAVPLHHPETRVVQTIPHTTGGSCRGDPVGALGAHAGQRRRVTCAILDTHESLRSLKVGFCHSKQSAGKFAPQNIHKTRSTTRTSVALAKPRLRIRRQGSTTIPEGKARNCGHAILGAREFLCVSWNSEISACPEISGPCTAHGVETAPAAETGKGAETAVGAETAPLRSACNGLGCGGVFPVKRGEAGHEGGHKARPYKPCRPGAFAPCRGATLEAPSPGAPAAPRSGDFVGATQFWSRNFGHARKFAQLEGGLLPQQTVGGQIRATEHSQNAQHDTNIGRSCQAAASNPPPRVNHDSGG